MSRLISQSVANLLNGVSQQPISTRRDTQLVSQENLHSSVVEGLKRRPPTKHVGLVTTGDWVGAFNHVYRRDAIEKYQVLIKNGSLKVFSLVDGAEKTVTVQDPLSYLTTTAAPQESLRATTISDFTFLLNREKTVAQTAAVAPVRAPEAIVWVKGGSYSKDYTVTVGTDVITYHTPSNAASANADHIDTQYIAKVLVEGDPLTAEIGNEVFPVTGLDAIAGITVERFGSVIFISKATDFAFSVEDGNGGNGMAGFKDVNQSFATLPPKAKDGFTIRIDGSDTTDYDNYYVKYESANDDGNGTWVETVAPGTLIALDPATMPHVLVSEANGTFTFRQATWDDMSAGDATTNPPPSFVGNEILSLSYAKNRLAFTSLDGVVMSEAGEFFNFFRTTVRRLLASAPIDLAPTSKDIAILHHTVPFNEDLLLFSEKSQFILEGGDVLSAETASIDPLTDFDVSPKCQPVVMGSSVFFAVDRGGYSIVREYFASRTESGATFSDIDVTGHAPNYVPSNLTHMAVSSNEETLVAREAGDTDTLWVYTHYWAGDQKAVSSWSKWTFPGTSIIGADFQKSNLVLFLQRGTDLYFEVLDLSPSTRDAGLDFLIHLDRKVEDADFVSKVYDSGTDETVVTFPYVVDASTIVAMGYNPAEEDFSPGFLPTVASFSGSAVRLTGDWSTAAMVGGSLYSSTAKLSEIILRDKNGTAKVNVRLQLRYLTILHGFTGAFSVLLEYLGRPNRTLVYTPRQFDSGDTVFDAAVVADGAFRFPVMSRSSQIDVTLFNDTHLPSSWTGLEWSANPSSKEN